MAIKQKKNSCKIELKKIAMNSGKNFIQGKWSKIIVKNKKKITASYDRIKDWTMDPKGYFLIDVDKKKNLLRAGYCKITKHNNSTIHEMIAEVQGKKAIEIVNTLIRKKFLSSFQHAADLDIELCKAELALKYNLKYTQDKDLIFTKS